jgi:hypothetical protein
MHGDTRDANDGGQCGAAPAFEHGECRWWRADTQLERERGTRHAVGTHSRNSKGALCGLLGWCTRYDAGSSVLCAPWAGGGGI